MTISWVGLIASVMLVLNFWPRGMIAVCLVMFLSFVAAAQEFSSYQSDGMLLEAAFVGLSFLLLGAGGLAWVRTAHLLAPAFSFCAGSGSVFTSNPGSSKWRATTPSGGA